MHSKIGTEFKRTLADCVVLAGMFERIILEHRRNYNKDKINGSDIRRDSSFRQKTNYKVIETNATEAI